MNQAHATIDPARLNLLLRSSHELAVLDVREKTAHNAGHILGATNLPRRLIEDKVAGLLPWQGVFVVVVDDDGWMAQRAASDLAALGYRNVSVLEGGMRSWADVGMPVSEGHSVPSKDFGELLAEYEDVPTVSPDELRAWLDQGRRVELCDVRTPEEHARETLPGSRSFPGFELASRADELDPEATVVVHCSGRTRSFIGTATLQRSGLQRVVALENGTMGWKLAGHELEHGAGRDATREVPRSPRSAVRWRNLASGAGAAIASPHEAQQLLDACGDPLGTVYLFDVRTEAEFGEEHAAGSRWAPSGQLVQLTDTFIAVGDATVLVMCDDQVRSAITSYWLRRMGLGRVLLVEGGLPLWRERGLPTETGMADRTLGLEAARAAVPTLGPRDLASRLEERDAPTVVHVGHSRGYRERHVPGARWVSPTWLETHLERVAPDRDTPLVLTCDSGRRSLLTVDKARRAGWRDVAALDGGTGAWAQHGYPVDAGWAEDGVEPDDELIHPIFRGPEAMRAYLDWEVRLGEKYAGHEDRVGE